MRSAFYQPSGMVPAPAAFALVCSLACAGLGALAYAWITLCDWWYLNPLLSCAFALWLAFVVGAACHLGKVRNPGLMREFGLVVGMSAWVFQWFFWIVFASHDTVRSMPGQSLEGALAYLLSGLGPLYSGLSLALQETDWSGDKDFLFLRLVSWLLELAILLAVPACAGYKRAGRPFCEVSKSWLTVTRLPQKFAGKTLLQSREYLARHPEQLLAALVPLASPQTCYANVTLYSGEVDRFISVEVTRIWVDRRQRGQYHDLIVKYLWVPARALDHFTCRLAHCAVPPTKPIAGASKRRARRSNTRKPRARR